MSSPATTGSTSIIGATAWKTFVLAADYNPSAFQGIAERLRHDPSWKVHTLPCGHDTMVDLPRETADLLLTEA